MRYGELSGKEIVNLENGSRLGLLGQTDIELDENTGRINAFIIPSYRFFGLKKEETDMKIEWKDIEKIGEDMIIVNRASELS